MNSLENNNRTASQDFQTALGLLEERLRSLEDSEDIIDGLLQGAAEFYGAARASVVEADWDLKIGLLTYEWCAEGVEPQRICSVSRRREISRAGANFLSLNGPVVIPNMERSEIHTRMISILPALRVNPYWQRHFPSASIRVISR